MMMSVHARHGYRLCSAAQLPTLACYNNAIAKTPFSGGWSSCPALGTGAVVNHIFIDIREARDS